MFKNLDEVVELLIKASNEPRPLFRMGVLRTQPSELLRLVLSMARWGLFKVPKPKWTPNTGMFISDDKCTKVIAQLLIEGEFTDPTQFYMLPIKVQQLLHYSSTCKTLRLNEAQLVSTTDVLPIIDIVKAFGVSPAQDVEVCPKCGKEEKDGNVCLDCCFRLLKCTEYRSESFFIYGTSVTDFELRFRDWKLEVVNSRFNFERLLESTEEYQTLLPFEEYRDDSLVL